MWNKNKSLKYKNMSTDKEMHGLSKIPDSVLLKECRIEIGKYEAYILELQDTISKNIDIKKNVRMEKNNRRLVKQNKKLQKELSEGRKADTKTESERLIAFTNYLNRTHDYDIKTHTVRLYLKQLSKA